MSGTCMDCKTENNIIRSQSDAYMLKVGQYVNEICYNCAMRRIRMQHMTNAQILKMK